MKNQLVLYPSFLSFSENVDKTTSKVIVIGDPRDYSLKWELHFGERGLYYVTGKAVGLEQTDRLYCLLRLCHPKLIRQLPNYLSPVKEYKFLYQLLLNNYLTLVELKRLIENLSQEALIQALSIQNPEIETYSSEIKQPAVIDLVLPEILPRLEASILQWQCRRLYFSSPYLRLGIQYEQVQPFLMLLEKQGHNTQGERFLLALLKLIKQKASIYQIAGELLIPPIILTRILTPLVKQRLINTLPADASIAKKLVVHIDDSSFFQEVIRTSLEPEGFKIVSISKSTQAIETLLALEKPALIISDLNMPGLNGLELCRLIRQISRFREVPIVMLTGQDGILDQVRARVIGIKKYLTKPFEPVHLVQTVRQVLKS